MMESPNGDSGFLILFLSGPTSFNPALPSLATEFRDSYFLKCTACPFEKKYLSNAAHIGLLIEYVATVPVILLANGFT